MLVEQWSMNGHKKRMVHAIDKIPFSEETQRCVLSCQLLCDIIILTHHLVKNDKYKNAYKEVGEDW